MLQKYFESVSAAYQYYFVTTRCKDFFLTCLNFRFWLINESIELPVAHIETSKLICNKNYLTGFYTRCNGTLNEHIGKSHKISFYF